MQRSLQRTAMTESLSPVPLQPGGAVLRRKGQSSAGPGTQTQARIAGGIANEASRRIGTLAILTAVTVVGASILHHALSPDIAAAQQTPLFRLSALFLVLAGGGLAALQRSALQTSQDLLDLGLVFEIGGALALSLMENAIPLPGSMERVHRRRGLDCHLRDGDPEPPVEEHHSGDRFGCHGSLRAPVGRANSRLSGDGMEQAGRIYARRGHCRGLDAVHQHSPPPHA
jgi:hypothetical protein